MDAPSNRPPRRPHRRRPAMMCRSLRWIAVVSAWAVHAAVAQDSRPVETPSSTVPVRPVEATPEAAILQALVKNPITSPYLITAGHRGGRIVLSGRVGTKDAHDVAVRLALAVTPSIDDQLVIDS